MNGAVLVDGQLVCECCRKELRFDLVVKRSGAHHLCRRCRPKSKCPICGRWVRRMVANQGRCLICLRCDRRIERRISVGGGEP